MFQWNLLHPLSTPTMKAASSFEMSVHFYQATWLHIPEECNLQFRIPCTMNLIRGGNKDIFI
jgi:hypothetical protein